MLNTRGMPGQLKKELIVELDDAVGVRTCPVDGEVIAPSNLPVMLKLGPLPSEKRKTIELDVGPGPSGSEVRLRAVKSLNPALRWIRTKPKSFANGKGAAVGMELTPPATGAPVVQIEVQFDFQLPAQVTQKMTVEYEAPSS